MQRLALTNRVEIIQSIEGPNGTKGKWRENSLSLLELENLSVPAFIDVRSYIFSSPCPSLSLPSHPSLPLAHSTLLASLLLLQHSRLAPALEHLFQLSPLLKPYVQHCNFPHQPGILHLLFLLFVQSTYHLLTYCHDYLLCIYLPSAGMQIPWGQRSLCLLIKFKIVPASEEVLNKYLLMNCEDSMWHCK